MADKHEYKFVANLSDGTEKEIGAITITDGESGSTPVITLTASAEFGDGVYEIPVTKTGTDAAPSYKLDFSNLSSAMLNYFRNSEQLTLNGVSVLLDDFAIYAPVSAGVSGQILQSSGDGAPVWVDIETSDLKFSLTDAGLLHIEKK